MSCTYSGTVSTIAGAIFPTGRRLTNVMSFRGFMIRWNVVRSALHEAWPAWLLIGGFTFTWLLAYSLASLISPDLSSQVRYAGSILEILGLLSVAHGISQLRRRFERPSLIARIVQWFKQVGSAFRKPEPQNISISGSGHIMTAGDVTLTVTAPKGASLERRIEVLEQNLDILRGESQKKTDQLQTRIAEVNKNLQDERDQRAAGDKNATVRIEEVAIGGLQLEIVGLLWLIAGALGTSIPEEISTVVVWLST